MDPCDLELITVGSPSDAVCAAVMQLGFMPRESLVVICMHGRRGRFGLVMRFDLDHPGGGGALALDVAARVEAEHADAVIVAAFGGDPVDGPTLPHEWLIDELEQMVEVEVIAAYLVQDERLWSYYCKDACCFAPDGLPLDFASPSATRIGAALALAGHAMLPDRDAVARSLGCDLDESDQERIVRRILAARVRQRKRALAGLQQSMRKLAGTLVAAQRTDPRAPISERDAIEFAALAFEPVVRDEVLVLAVDQDDRRALLAVLRELVRRTPPFVDAPVCSMLGWISYVDGDGVIAALCVERALSTNPDYSLANLINDALHRQIPPRMLEEVMQGAARDLRSRDTAG